MKFTSLIVCIFSLIYAATSEDLMCYSCVYYPGHNLSDSNCLTNPNSTTLVNCATTVIPGLRYETQDETTSELDSYTTGRNTSAASGGMIKVSRKSCVVYTGTFYSENFVIRGCGFNTIKDNCTTSAYVSLNGTNSNSTKACFCSNDNCNGPHASNSTTTNVPIITTTGKPHNGTSGRLLTSYSLFAVTIALFIYNSVA